MEPTERVEIGSTGVVVSRLGVGLAALIGHAGQVDDGTADGMLAQAHQLGLRYVDVAALYGYGRGEAAVRRLLDRSGSDDVVVSAKAGRLLRPRTLRNRLRMRISEFRVAPDRRRLAQEDARIVVDRVRSRIAGGGTPRSSGAPPENRWVARFDLSARGVRRSADESLRRLGRDQVGILYLHDPDRLGPASLRSAWAVMQDLRASGAARAIGIASNDAVALARMTRACDVDVVLLAGRYSLMDQSALDDLFPLLLDRDIALVLGGVFNGGLLAAPDSGRFDYRPASGDESARARRIGLICRRHGVSPVAAAMQFAAAHPAVTSLLVGVRSASELTADVAHARSHIPSGLWRDLLDAELIRPDAPVPDDDVADVAAS